MDCSRYVRAARPDLSGLVDPAGANGPAEDTDDESSDVHDVAQVEVGECLDCYLNRMLARYGCDGHLFTQRWIDAQPEPLTGLMGWLESQGGICCDCEVAMNVFGRRRSSRRFPHLSCGRVAH